MPEPKKAKNRKADSVDDKPNAEANNLNTDEEKENQSSPRDASAKQEPETKVLKQNQLPFGTTRKPQSKAKPTKAKAVTKQATLNFGQQRFAGFRPSLVATQSNQLRTSGFDCRVRRRSTMECQKEGGAEMKDETM